MINNIIDLWENYSYESVDPKDFRPKLETYILKGEKKRPAVLICPGGGYGYTSPREAEPIAMQFNAAGYHALVLYYSVAPNRHPQPLMDLSRAMCIIRDNAEMWKVLSEKIAVCGFSAGGHLAASLGVYWDQPYLNIPGIEIGMNCPNALILSYPVISSGEFAHRGSFSNLLGLECSGEKLHEMSLEYHISAKTPPTFIWHTFADKSVPLENTLLFAQSLRKCNIPFEMHIFPEGPHGLSLANEETATENTGVHPHVASWIRLCIEWLDRIFK